MRKRLTEPCKALSGLIKGNWGLLWEQKCCLQRCSQWWGFHVTLYNFTLKPKEISYFSLVEIKHFDQKQLTVEESVWGCCRGPPRWGGITASPNHLGGTESWGAPILSFKDKAENANSSENTYSHWCTTSSKDAPSKNPPQTALPTGI